MRNHIETWALALGVLALVSACGDGENGGPRTVVPSDTTQLVGLYDVRFTGMTVEYTHAAVGSAHGSGRELGVTLYPPGVESVRFNGTLAEDGTLVVADSFGWESDFGFAVTVEARAAMVGDRLRITGTVSEASTTLLPAFRFEMERQVGARSDGFSGAWTVAFPESPGTCRCSSSAHLVLSVGSDGRGSTLSTEEVAEGRRIVGFLHEGVALVSPEGRVRVQMIYGTPTPSTCALGASQFQEAPCNVTLSGTLTERAEGTVLLREPALGIPLGGIGEWSATRVPTPLIPEGNDPAFGQAGHVLLADATNPHHDPTLDYLWVGFSDAHQWEAFIALRELLAPSRPWICGTVVPSQQHPLGVYVDPDSVTVAEVTAETFQVVIDEFKHSAERRHVCPAGVRIERIVPNGPSGD